MIIFSAFERYADPKNEELTVPKETTAFSRKNNKPSPAKMLTAERFKIAYSHRDVRVHFVGAWYVLVTLPFQIPPC